MEALLQFAVPAAPLDHREAEAIRLRAKIVGVLIRRSRMAASLSIEDCAKCLQVSTEQISNWEYGDYLPGPPELKRLADCLKVPLSSFWQHQEPIELARCSRSSRASVENDQQLALRQRLRGGLLRAARELKGMSIQGLSDMSNIDCSLIRAYEYGERAMPPNHLRALANSLERDIDFFLAGAQDSGAILELGATTSPAPTSAEAEANHAADQKTKGIIKLAVALSQIPSEELRGIADALTAISKAKSGGNGA